MFLTLTFHWVFNSLEIKSYFLGLVLLSCCPCRSICPCPQTRQRMGRMRSVKNPSCSSATWSVSCLASISWAKSCLTSCWTRWRPSSSKTSRSGEQCNSWTLFLTMLSRWPALIQYTSNLCVPIVHVSNQSTWNVHSQELPFTEVKVREMKVREMKVLLH